MFARRFARGAVSRAADALLQGREVCAQSRSLSSAFPRLIQPINEPQSSSNGASFEFLRFFRSFSQPAAPIDGDLEPNVYRSPVKRLPVSSLPQNIGYRVIDRLSVSGEEIPIPSVDKFAVVQVGPHQFKVTAGDAIYVEKLKYTDINDKLALEKVLLLGDKSQTVIGRPTVPDAVVTAVVEEQALDAKVIVFKKKRRKNYRRQRGHRQELTRLRILDIVGLESEDFQEETREATL